MLETLKNNWKMIKENFRDEYGLTSVSYNTWIMPLEVYDFKDNTAILVFSGNCNSFSLNYITKKYTFNLKVMIEEVTGIKCSVEIISEEEYKPNSLWKNNKFSSEPTSAAKKKANLNPKYTFDSFVVGTNNQFAHAVSLSVAETPGAEYNPLFIYGGPGLGKTHLMHSIGNFIIDKNPESHVLYVTSEIFTNELVDAFRNKNGVTMSEFKNKYRNIDTLLIDDIQFIIGKGSTEEEFFNTFNFLSENHKQIVISSDRPPRDFLTLGERLRSRFEMGLSVDITPPTYETRMAILRKKEEIEGYTIDNEILHYIADNIRTNIRELEGALTKMYAYSKLHQNVPLTLDVAKENLKDIINPNIENKLTPDKIINIVAEQFGINPDLIKSQKRTKEIVTARHVSMYLIRLLVDISLEEIGKSIGNRDHSTIIYGYEKITKDLNNDKELSAIVDIIKKKLIQ